MAVKYPYFRLYQTISRSEYGQILVKNIRFNRFKPQSINNSTWERILGPDVNNLRHMWFTKKLVDKFLDLSPKNQFTLQDKHLLRLTAVIHDVAESIVGDIPKIHKTLSDEQQEQVFMTNIIHQMTKNGQINSEDKSQIFKIIDHILFPSKPTYLSQTFSVIEYLGYLHTACIAGIQAESRRHQQSPLVINLQLLAKEVTRNSLDKLSAHTQTYPAINHLIYTTHPYRYYLSKLDLVGSYHDYFQNFYPLIQGN